VLPRPEDAAFSWGPISGRPVVAVVQASQTRMRNDPTRHDQQYMETPIFIFLPTGLAVRAWRRRQAGHSTTVRPMRRSESHMRARVRWRCSGGNNSKSNSYCCSAAKSGAATPDAKATGLQRAAWSGGLLTAIGFGARAAAGGTAVVSIITGSEVNGGNGFHLRHC
jgi:hypothetical protein